MTTRWKYFLYLLVLHLLLGVMAYLLLQEQLAFFLLVELALLISLYVANRFYRTFMAPVELVDQGEAAMLDQDFTLKFLPVGSKEVDRLGNLYNQMIDNLRAERTSTQEQHFFLQKLIETAQLGVIILDYDGKISSINEWAGQRLQIDQRSFPEYLGEIEHPLGPALAELPKNEAVVLQFSGNQRFRCEKGDFVDRGFGRSFLIIQDITQDLLAAERKAYGKVIRMMAHEVNNSTGATNSLLQSLVDADDLPAMEYRSLVGEYLPTVIDRGARMNKFMRNFADVIRLPTPKRELVDLGKLLQRLATLFSAQCAEDGIEIRMVAPQQPVLVLGDAGQLEQVVINAIANARESIGQDGIIELSVQPRPAGFTIADDGPGIATDDQDKIFTPFFSTKPTGQGVGLTLSRDILEHHDTAYSLQTDPDGWTRFQVRFN